jgi:integrase
MGSVACVQGDVLYLALEDNRRRVKDRLLTLCPARKLMKISLDRLTVRTVAPRIDTGLLVELDKWRRSCANPRLIIIDVFLKVRPPRKKGEDAYAADYDAVTPLQRYASEHRLAIVLVTHTRKMEAEDGPPAGTGSINDTGALPSTICRATNSARSKQRLAMGLLLYTGQRISDAMRLGPANLQDGWLVFTQYKNRNRKPIHMQIPVRPELLELIEATPTGSETFLTNSLGKAYTAHRCGDWFAEACLAAGVPGRSHGLRKAAASRLAELGASEKEIMSITGHTTSQEIRRYTEAADKRILAEKATAKHVKKKETV